MSLAPKLVSVKAQANLLEVKFHDLDSQSGGGQRGVIREFSAASRRRLMTSFQRIEQAPTLFLTLTYHHNMCDAAQAHRDLKVWLARVARAYPRVGALWRLEQQQRGAWHFHLLLWGVKWLGAEWVRRSWSEVVGHWCPQVHLKLLVNSKQACYYLSKYCAKVAQPQALGLDPDAEGGDNPAPGLEGEQGGVDCAGAVAVRLDEGAYSPAGTGRHWGYAGRAYVPFGRRFLGVFRYGAWVEDLKAVAREQWAGIGGAGFVLWGPHAEDWLVLASGYAGVDAIGEYVVG